MDQRSLHGAQTRELRPGSGGYTGCVGDLDGYRWEIATNPGPIKQEVLP